MANVKNDIELEYSARVGMAHRKKFAQFFTPVHIAEVMVDWLVGNKELHSVLEPAFGLGVFSRVLLDKVATSEVSIIGYDIDDTVLTDASHLFENKKCVAVRHQDYIESDFGLKYDGIVCNPPYLKFHDYDNKRCVEVIRNRLDIPLNLNTNLYALFLIKSLSQLAAGGRCAYVLPAEFLNSDYGVKVKKFLIQSGMLRHLVVFDYTDNLFDDALTTSAILLCANDNRSSKVGFSKVSADDGVAKIANIIAGYPDIGHADRVIDLDKVDPEIKWKNYYSNTENIEFSHLVPFSSYGKVMRGIATGANDYFSFNKSKVAVWHLGGCDLQPCICHSADIAGLSFNEFDYQNLYNKDRNVLVFNPVSGGNAAVRYVRYGEECEIDKRFLTSKRSPWYALEKRAPAPIWVSVFNRSGLKFVRNETDVLNLTTFHCVYVHDNILGVDADLMFAYLISNTAKKLLASSSREYGNGLTKFEPNDLNKSMMLDLGLLDWDVKERIRNIYRVNKRSTDMRFVDEIDRILIAEFSV